MEKTRKIITLAVFVSQALVLSMIENLIPLPTAFPGVKLGLANIIVITTIVFLGFKDALVLVALRTAIFSFLTGGLTLFLFSISGGMLSAIAMSIVYYRLKNTFSIIGISIIGAVTHNIGQLMAAAAIMKDLSVMNYLPVLMLSGIATGSLVGVCSKYLVKALRKSRIFEESP
ncbi:MAG: Gx transporter family protein [Clostridiaceae bacterium]|nr:Gx transporter family protein [Clostridiaceae bacterium]